MLFSLLMPISSKWFLPSCISYYNCYCISLPSVLHTLPTSKICGERNEKQRKTDICYGAWRKARRSNWIQPNVRGLCYVPFVSISGPDFVQRPVFGAAHVSSTGSVSFFSPKDGEACNLLGSPRLANWLDFSKVFSSENGNRSGPRHVFGSE